MVRRAFRGCGTMRTRIAAGSRGRRALLVGLAALGTLLLVAAASVLRAADGRDAVIALTSRLGGRAVATADDAVAPAAGLAAVGVNTFLEQEVETASRRRTLAMAREAGFGAIRQQFPWAEIEPDARGVY